MSVQQKKYVTYTAPVDGPNAPSITLLESQAVLASSGTTGLRTWEAALCLGAFLCSTKGMRFVDGKRLIELGAGTGFVSLLCAKHLGAECVLATDGSTEVVDALASNVYVNHLDKSNKITARILKWGHDTVKDTLNEDSTSGSYELILGADVVCTTGSKSRYSACCNSHPIMAEKLLLLYKTCTIVVLNAHFGSRHMTNNLLCPWFRHLTIYSR